MIDYDRISKCYTIFLNLFGVTVEEFNSILQKVNPTWRNEILGKYKRPGRRFTLSRIIKKLEPLLAKAILLPKERLLSKEEAMCIVDATEESIERLRRELERKITIRGRRSKNYHMIVIKPGLGRTM